MAIDESYRLMLDQLAGLRVSASPSLPSLTDLMAPLLSRQEATAKSLADLFTQNSLLLAHDSAKSSVAMLQRAQFEAEESRSLGLMAAAAASVEIRPREEFSLLLSTIQGVSWEKELSRSRDFAAAAVASFEKQPHQDVWVQVGILETAKLWEKELANSHGLLDEASLRWDAGWRDGFRSLTAIESFGAAVPKLAVTGWPIELVSERIGLIEHSFKNVSALQLLEGSAIASGLTATSGESLTAAGQLVFSHGDLLRRMPPSLPINHGADAGHSDFGHRNEEVGAKLESLLPTVDPRLLDLRRQSWRKLAEGVAGARLAMLGLREVFSEVLRRFAPDDEITNSDAWKGRIGNGPPRPTRRERITFLMGSDAPALEAVLQFNESIEFSNKFSHTFADDPESVRVRMAQLENWIYMILLYARKRV
jgi:hypothetical protein